MTKQSKKYMSFIMLTFGTLILALGINFFLAPNGIAPGGVTGLAIVIKKLTGVNVSITNLVINIPLFIAGIIILGKGFGVKTAYGTLSLSAFLFLLEKYSWPIYITNDMLLLSIFGGIFTGIGIGFVFRSGGTTGGTDLGGAIINHYLPDLSIAKAMMAIDFLVVVSAGIVNKSYEISLYSLVSLYVIVKMADFIVEGLDYSKSFHIITREPELVSKKIIKELNRGVTALSGRGMYTGQGKEILFCVVRRNQVSKLKKLVYEIDEYAFLTVSNTHEVLGEGFTREKNK